MIRAVIFDMFERLITHQLRYYVNSIPGIVDNGLFVDMASRVIVGYQNGDIKEFEVKVS